MRKRVRERRREREGERQRQDKIALAKSLRPSPSEFFMRRAPPRGFAPLSRVAHEAFNKHQVRMRPGRGRGLECPSAVPLFVVLGNMKLQMSAHTHTEKEKQKDIK